MDKAERDELTCPKCGAAMVIERRSEPADEPGTRWICSRSECGVCLLLPGSSVEMHSVMTQITQSSLHIW